MLTETATIALAWNLVVEELHHIHLRSSFERRSSKSSHYDASSKADDVIIIIITVVVMDIEQFIECQDVQ